VGNSNIFKNLSGGRTPEERRFETVKEPLYETNGGPRFLGELRDVGEGGKQVKRRITAGKKGRASPCSCIAETHTLGKYNAQ